MNGFDLLIRVCIREGLRAHQLFMTVESATEITKGRGEKTLGLNPPKMIWSRNVIRQSNGRQVLE